MGDLIPFFPPSDILNWFQTAEQAQGVIYEGVSREKNDIYIEDVTITLAHTVYKCFHEMGSEAVTPDIICAEIDSFLELMVENLPIVKQQVWELSKGETHA